MNPILSLLFGFFYSALAAQSIPDNPNLTDAKGLRQGPWTIMYTAEWQPTRSDDSAAYYRLVEYRNDKPAGLVRDYFRDGVIQFQATLVEDRPNDVYDGEVVWFRRNGEKESVAHYKKGTLQDQTHFNLDGSVAEQSWAELNTAADEANYHGLYDSALNIYERAFEQAKLEFESDHPNYTLALNNLGVSYFYSGMYDKSIPLFEQANEIKARIYGKGSKQYARGLTNLAGIYYTLGNHQEALPLYREALAIYEQAGGRDADFAYTLMEVGSVYRELGDYKQAEAAFLESLKITEATIGKENENYPTILSAAAAMYEILGDFSRAEVMYTEAMEIVKKTRGKEHPEYARLLNNLAILYDYLGNFERAKENYIEAIATLEATVGKDHPEYATQLNNLGALYYAMKDTANALRLYRESTQIVERVLGKEHRDYTIRLINMGGIFSEMKQYEIAEKMFTEALSIRERILGKEHIDYAMALHVLGRLYIDVGEFAKAEQLLQQSLQIRQKILGRQHPDYAMALREMALLYTGSGDLKKAEEYFNLSNSQLIHQINSHFSTLSDKEKSAFYTERIGPQFEFFNSFVLLRMKENPDITATLYNNQLATKALLFHTSNKIRQRIQNSRDESLKSLYSQWIENRTMLSRLYQMGEKDVKSSGVSVDSLEDVLNNVEKQLSARSELFAGATDHTMYTWKHIQENLKRNEAAVEVIRFRQYDKAWTDTIRYAALIVTATSTRPEYVLLRQGHALENRAFNYYKNSIRGKVDDLFSYDLFWRPIGDALKINKKVRKVYFSPDGVYNSINLKTLRNPETNSFLGDEINVRLVTNTKDLLLPKRALKPTPNAALFGFPQYDTRGNILPADETRSVDASSEAGEIKRFFDGGRITSLPGTRTEINTVSKLLAESKVPTVTYLSENATEEQIRGMNSPAILHVATHGFFMESAGYAEGRSFNGIEKTRNENPLLRSGLLLAGAQLTVDGEGTDNDHDGILTAYEAMSLNLDSTDLVVLSACETGLGEIRNGEGVYGLQRAFQTAGAQSVLMSLWKVDDQATQELMTEFYRQWLKHGDKAEALDEAQQKLRASFPHPYYWGAFVLVGE